MQLFLFETISKSVSGLQGNRGYGGSYASLGSQGFQGSTGAQGIQGFPGLFTDLGFQGTNGADGDTGYDGSTGADAPEVFVSRFAPDVIYGGEGDLWIRH